MSIIPELIKLGLGNSIAQAFLLFSWALLALSITTSSPFISVIFFTVFYAFIAHFFTALRRHGSLGEKFVGGDEWQTVLFTVAYAFYFVWWSTGIWALLNVGSSVDLLGCTVKFSTLSLLTLALATVSTLVLFSRFFWKLLTKGK